MEKNIFEMMERKQLETKNGAVIYWISKFQHTAQTLVFLHGLTADHTMFEKQVLYFRNRFNLLCLDAPAHGKSRPYANFSYANAATTLRDILQREHIQKVVLVGQSMGGYISQTFLKYYSNIVVGFVGIDTTPFGTEYYTKSDVWWLRQIEWMSMCFPHSLLTSAIAKSCTYTEEAYNNMLIALSPYSKKELCKLMGIGYAGFLKENCNLEIQCPVLILVGEHDKTGKVKQYCIAWNKKTSFPLHIIPNAAHNSNFDNGEAVNSEIEHFMQHILLKEGQGQENG